DDDPLHGDLVAVLSVAQSHLHGYTHRQVLELGMVADEARIRAFRVVFFLEGARLRFPRAQGRIGSRLPATPSTAPAPGLEGRMVLAVAGLLWRRPDGGAIAANRRPVPVQPV